MANNLWHQVAALLSASDEVQQEPPASPFKTLAVLDTEARLHNQFGFVKINFCPGPKKS